MKVISVINGPNLNLLGQRENNIYGTESLTNINNQLVTEFKNRAKLDFFHSNHEGDLIDHIQKLDSHDGIIINPGALTHTSIALHDTLLAKNIPTIEVHLSNIYNREEFRKISYISKVALGVISGFKKKSYFLAIEAILDFLKS